MTLRNKLLIIFLCQAMSFANSPESFACPNHEKLDKLIVNFDCKSDCGVNLSYLRNKLKNKNYKISFTEKNSAEKNTFWPPEDRSTSLEPAPITSTYSGYFSVVTIDFGAEISSKKYDKIYNFMRKYVNNLGFNVLDKIPSLCG